MVGPLAEPRVFLGATSLGPPSLSHTHRLEPFALGAPTLWALFRGHVRLLRALEPLPATSAPLGQSLGTIAFRDTLYELNTFLTRGSTMGQSQIGFVVV